MKVSRRIAAMITLGEPYKHHFEVFNGIRTYALEQGWSCSAKPYAQSDFSGQSPRPYDGVVGRITRPMIDAARKYRIPLVNVYMGLKVSSLPNVFLDTRDSARMAAEHLMGRGFRNFVYIGMHGGVFSRWESAEFKQLVEAEGFPCTCYVVSRNFDLNARKHAEFQRDLHEWIAAWPTPIGVFTAHDLLAYYVIEACREQGLRIPFEVGVVGSHNESNICLNCDPTITSIERHFEKVGYKAAEMLGQLMGGAPAPTEPVRVKPRQLYVRGSSDAAVVEDPRVARALQFIADNSRGSLSVEDVAAHVKTNPRTLARLFDRALGRSIYSEISRFRIEYIKRQLVDTDIPINQLAAECGFSSPSHLSRLFQSVEGVRPGQFRRRMT